MFQFYYNSFVHPDFVFPSPSLPFSVAFCVSMHASLLVSAPFSLRRFRRSLALRHHSKWVNRELRMAIANIHIIHTAISFRLNSIASLEFTYTQRL